MTKTAEEIKNRLRLCSELYGRVGDNGHTINTMRDAIVIIEQLEAENAKLKRHMTPLAPVDVEGKVWACPTCYNNLLWIWKDYPTEKTNLREGLPFCLSCGQKLKWSDDILRKCEKEQTEAMLNELFGGNV